MAKGGEVLVPRTPSRIAGCDEVMILGAAKIRLTPLKTLLMDPVDKKLPACVRATSETQWQCFVREQECSLWDDE